VSNEHIWAGKFGDDYTARCDKDYTPRMKFWGDIIYKTRAKNILEVGCGAGQNIDILSKYLPKKDNAWGCDVNQKALRILKQRHSDLNAVSCSGYNLPFKDDWFELVFTAGVLIHQKPEEVDVMVQEIIRVSRKYVLAMEYESEMFEEVPYRGQKEALFKGPFGALYEKKYGMKLVDTGFVGKEAGFDDLTWWLLRKY
jgi:pseudaminic acid biosynthesis-associated methylase